MSSQNENEQLLQACAAKIETLLTPGSVNLSLITCYVAERFIKGMLPKLEAATSDDDIQMARELASCIHITADVNFELNPKTIRTNGGNIENGSTTEFIGTSSTEEERDGRTTETVGSGNAEEEGRNQQS
jgi:hypothetical protein